MNIKLVNALHEYYESNGDERLNACRAINSYDGTLDFCDTFDTDEILHIFKPEDAINRIIYGNVTNAIDPVRCNGYGNFESVSEYELIEESSDYIDASVICHKSKEK